MIWFRELKWTIINFSSRIIWNNNNYNSNKYTNRNSCKCISSRVRKDYNNNSSRYKISLYRKIR